MAKDIVDLNRNDLADAVANKVDGVVYGSANKLKRTALQVAASGFGKGLMIAAGIVVVGTALYFGFGAATGILHTLVPATGAWAPATVAKGLSIGVYEGLNAVFSGIGLLAMAVGGTIGSVISSRAHQNKLNAEMAKIQAQEYEMARQQQPQPTIQQQPAMINTVPEVSFAAREQARNELKMTGVNEVRR